MNPYEQDIVINNLKRSEFAILSGLLELYKEKPFGSITVNEIMLAGHCARNTFYKYFKDTSDALSVLENVYLTKIYKVITRQQGFRIQSYSYVEEMLKVLLADRDAYMTLLVIRPNYRMIEKWKNIIKYQLYEYIPEKNRTPLLLEMYSTNVINALIFWLRNPLETSKEEVAKLLTRFNQALY